MMACPVSIAPIVTQTRHKLIRTVGEIRLMLLYLSESSVAGLRSRDELKELLESPEFVLFLTLGRICCLPAPVPFLFAQFDHRKRVKVSPNR